ncbi:hypothetical protein K2173_027952 [Erythroxylum novogranatense]|uniref:Cytochrome b/b6 C-terminal region profile domain-containing protein n=1 Tax=Erythroxylum novogranatense TaxID=1862640 RepID=A0AAV8U328_9ROSI|nr:hypothetical protein K2173_027952 [Erythroxylum novogranatense]
MGHNYYGEPVWPNDLLYIFPVVIIGTIACNVGLAVLEPSMIGEPADPFATPLEILSEWYFFLVFQILRTVPNKLLGVLLMVSVLAGFINTAWLVKHGIVHRSLGFDYQGIETLQVKLEDWHSIAVILYVYGYNYLRS